MYGTELWAETAWGHLKKILSIPETGMKWVYRHFSLQQLPVDEHWNLQQSMSAADLNITNLQKKTVLG